MLQEWQERERYLVEEIGISYHAAHQKIAEEYSTSSHTVWRHLRGVKHSPQVLPTERDSSVTRHQDPVTRSTSVSSTTPPQFIAPLYHSPLMRRCLLRSCLSAYTKPMATSHGSTPWNALLSRAIQKLERRYWKGSVIILRFTVFLNKIRPGNRGCQETNIDF